jgi:prepilin signal peptidase PulO-like enzyme (type II secretory pathway)
MANAPNSVSFAFISRCCTSFQAVLFLAASVPTPETFAFSLHSTLLKATRSYQIRACGVLVARAPSPGYLSDTAVVSHDDETWRFYSHHVLVTAKNSFLLSMPAINTKTRITPAEKTMLATWTGLQTVPIRTDRTPPDGTQACRQSSRPRLAKPGARSTM